MVYPGNPELSGQAQERVMTAFRQVVAKLQDGRREEALIGLEFVLRLDPSFAPAKNLQHQLASGSAEIDLSEIIAQLRAPTTDAINQFLVEAVELFNQRQFLDAKEMVERVLADLPGHPEARQLLGQIQNCLKVEGQVGQFLAQAREALDLGDPQEAANFVLMAQALDPHHPGISPMLEAIQSAGGSTANLGPLDGGHDAENDDIAISFATVDDRDPGFAADLADAAAPLQDDFASPAQPATQEPHDDFFGAGEVDFGGEPGGDEMGDLSDLFEVDAVAQQPAAPERPPIPDQGNQEASRIEQLLATGSTAFDQGDYQGAIDAWSRIYLIDPAHDEATERIDEARRRKEEIDRRVEHMLYDAQEAAVSGDSTKARRLVDEVLALQPNHIEAIELRDSLDSAGAGAVAARDVDADVPSMPDLEDDLFQEDLPADRELAVAHVDLADHEASSPSGALPAPARRGLPVRALVFALIGLVVLALGVWFGSRLLSSNTEADQTEALNRALVQAEALFKQGHTEEAIELLHEFPATGLDQTRIARRLARYQQALAPPTPTPVAQTLVDARAALEEGRWLAAYRAAMEGLKRSPQDSGMLEVRAKVLEHEPRLATLYNLLQSGDTRAAVNVARDLARDYPDSPEVGAELDRVLFNAAVDELRGYNLTGGEGLLRELSRRRPDDAVVARTLELIEKYKSRPVDPLMETYIASLGSR
jgi:tetratricopeptide (TPR) repeat protein